MDPRRRDGPAGEEGATTPGAWDRAGALCALARLLLEPSVTAPEERAAAVMQAWPGVDGDASPEVASAIREAAALVEAARRRWEADRRRDEQVRALVGAERAAAVEAEGARAENALWTGFADELRSTIGHDLRNPLSVLSGHAQLLEAGLVGPAATRTTGETLLRQVDRLGVMFDRLVSSLAIAAVASGRAQGEPTGWEPVEVGVEAALRDLPTAARERVERGPGQGWTGAPMAARAAFLAVVKAALLAGSGPVRVESGADASGDVVVVTSDGLRRGRPDPRTGWTRGGVDPSGALAAIARYVRALGGEMEASPGRVTLRWPPPGPEVVGLVADPARAPLLAARVLPPLRVVVRVAAPTALAGHRGPVLVDAGRGAIEAWRDACAGLSRPPPAVVLGAPADTPAFAVLPDDATAVEVTAELARAVAAEPTGSLPPERVDVVIELADVEGLVAAVGPGGPERALRWVEGVAQWLGGSSARISRLDGARVALACGRGDPALLADRIVECCAGIRPRIGPFRVSVPVRALVPEPGALREGSWLGGPAAPDGPGSRD